MGEVNTGQKRGSGPKGLVKKGKKLSTRIDMTPVVDLSFLLLTFFMLATTFIKPQVMGLILPEKQNKENKSIQPKVNEKKVLSIVLGRDKKVYWYVGMTDPQVHETGYSSVGIRKVLQEENKLINGIVVLIKPDATSTYGNLVDMLDDLELTHIARYALVDIKAEDRAILAKYKGKDAVTPVSGPKT